MQMGTTMRMDHMKRLNICKMYGLKPFGAIASHFDFLFAGSCSNDNIPSNVWLLSLRNHIKKIVDSTVYIVTLPW